MVLSTLNGAWTRTLTEGSTREEKGVGCIAWPIPVRTVIYPGRLIGRACISGRGSLNPIKRGSLVRRCSLQGPENDRFGACAPSLSAEAGTEPHAVLPWQSGQVIPVCAAVALFDPIPVLADQLITRATTGITSILTECLDTYSYGPVQPPPAASRKLSVGRCRLEIREGPDDQWRNVPWPLTTTDNLSLRHEPTIHSAGYSSSLALTPALVAFLCCLEDTPPSLAPFIYYSSPDLTLPIQAILASRTERSKHHVITTARANL